MVWRASDPTGGEAIKMKYELVPYTRGRGLDLGCGNHKAFPHFIGVDSNIDSQIFKINCRPDILLECTDLAMFGSGSMDFIFSSHLLEHVEDTHKTLKEWWRLIKVGGYLCLYLPHKNFYPNIGTKGSNPDHKHDFLPEDITKIMLDIGHWDLVENQERNEGREYSFFQVYKRIQGKNLYSYKKPKPEKTCAVVRYGAIGDILQTASVLAALKKEGWHTTLYCTPRGHECLLHDPNVDQFIIQDTDQVPNNELGPFWEHIKKKYDKFVNLCECVEGTLLSIPGRASHDWPKEVRHQRMNRNYLEFMHELAEVPFEPKAIFYPTDLEVKWAEKEKKKIGNTVVLWTLAGSSVHKTWPWMDNIIAAIMLETDWHVVLVGDEMCQILEAGWEKEPRVHRRSGKWNIRQTLSFLGVCDLIIGPETGVMNAAGMLNTPKIVTLSHSTDENLTKHWINTTALVPDNTRCYPCHMLHYSFEHCVKDHDENCEDCKNDKCAVHTGAAKCQSNISADHMWSAIVEIMDGKQRKVV